MSAPLIACPFCGEEDFDQVGLQGHLTGESSLFGSSCEAFSRATTDEAWADWLRQGGAVTPADDDEEDRLRAEDDALMPGGFP